MSDLQETYRLISLQVLRDGNRARKYKVMPDEYQEMLLTQKGLCAICLNPETVMRKGVVKQLAIDHCHTTGKVRGLLCVKCNQALGLLKENHETVKGLLKYIEDRCMPLLEHGENP